MKDFVREYVAGGNSFQYSACGKSMLPTVGDYDSVVIEAVEASEISVGDIVLYAAGDSYVLHRVISKKPAVGGGAVLLTKGDSNIQAERLVHSDSVVGRAVAVSDRDLTSGFYPLAGKILAYSSLLQWRLYSLLRGTFLYDSFYAPLDDGMKSSLIFLFKNATNPVNLVFKAISRR
jgi:hypothetical protein